MKQGSDPKKTSFCIVAFGETNIWSRHSHTIPKGNFRSEDVITCNLEKQLSNFGIFCWFGGFFVWVLLVFFFTGAVLSD